MFCVLMSIYINDSLRNVKMSVASILSQSYSSYMLFIILDGNVDAGVYEYVTTIRDNRVWLIERKQNRGLAYSLNELLQLVLPKGYQYIARMDADDISMPDRFEKQLEYMEANPDLDCLGTWAVEIDSKENEYFRKRMPITHVECLRMFRKRDCMIHPTVVFRRSYFEKAGLYPEDTYFGEDTVMWAQGFKAGCRFGNLPEYLFKFRLDPNFFQRRRGWRHARSIWALRRCVNKMLGFGLREDFYALLYAIAKMMPTKILDLIYRKIR